MPSISDEGRALGSTLKYKMARKVKEAWNTWMENKNKI